MLRSRFMLPFGGIVLLFVLYTVYWFFAGSKIQASVEDWISDQEAAGYAIEHQGIRMGGFPFRFQVRIVSPTIAAPQIEGGWETQFAELRGNAMPHDLSLWRVDFYGPMLLNDYIEPGSRLQIDAARAAFSLSHNSDGQTERVGATIEQLAITTLAGPAPDVSAIEELLIGSAVEDSDALRLRIEARGVTAAPEALEPDVIRAFGQTADVMKVNLTVSEWSTLARSADANAWTRAGGQLEIVSAELGWGPAHLTGTGEFTLDAMARPDGRLSLRITDPDALADALVEGGLVPRENEEALRLAAMLAPRSPEGVSLPFRVNDGGIYIGPVRIGSLDR